MYTRSRHSGIWHTRSTFIIEFFSLNAIADNSLLVLQFNPTTRLKSKCLHSSQPFEVDFLVSLSSLYCFLCIDIIRFISHLKIFMLIASHRVDLNSNWLESDSTSDSFSLSLLFSHSRACHFVVHCFMHWSLSYTFYFQLSNSWSFPFLRLRQAALNLLINSLSLSFLREWCHIFNEKQCWCWTARAAPLTHRKKATTYRQHPNKHRNYHISNLLSTFCSTVLTACPDG